MGESINNKRPSADTVRFYYVYILLCFDGKPYTGCTDNLKDRIDRHKKGKVPATKERLPIKLVSYFAFSSKYLAYNFEKYLKSGSGRAFMAKHLLSTFKQ
jgi:predicted GIY-YIG superfamily endonuclease